MCWEISVPGGYKIPDRILNLTDRVAERYGMRTRTLDMSRYDDEVHTIVVPAFQGKAVDSLLYRALYESLYTP